MARPKIVWNKVTPFSKYLALSLFILLPILFFLLGMEYQRMLLGL
ncbi:MAG TPA: hypothetical protein VKC53_03835 [Patescibacteria group bacterium]|nr:hypothetical protein [Patescibacteria group bacterium]